MKRVLGFTLIELLLVMGIFMTLFFVSAPLSIDFFQRADLAASTEQVKYALRRSQQLARQGAQDDAWGVVIHSGETTLFKGSSFASRDVEYDETTKLPGSVTSSGVTEYVFQKQSGSTTPGSMTLSSAVGTRTISISGVGRIEEQ